MGVKFPHPMSNIKNVRDSTVCRRYVVSSIRLVTHHSLSHLLG